MAVAALTLLVSYLVGAIPFGYLIARARGVEIFQVGSGNIGATNVGRVLGRRFGLLVFVLDFCKGALPAAVATALGGALTLDLPPDALGVGAGLAAFLGHLFPVYLSFRGGKGVATGAGVVAVLLPGPALGALLLWLAVVGAARCVSLASLAAVAGLCLLRLLVPGPWTRDHAILTAFCFLAALLVLVRHRANIRRLLAGTENRLPESTTMKLLPRVLHLLALGLWFGTGVFFTFVVGVQLFGTFQALGERSDRPVWFQVDEGFGRDPREWSQAEEKASKPLFKDAAAVRREQGTRAAGAAVAPLFPLYFLIQGLCGLVAVFTALGWSRLEPAVRVHRWRTMLLFAALATVLAGWPLEQKVGELGRERDQLVDKVLSSHPAPTAESLEAARDAHGTFVMWHLVSLFLNFGTVILVTGALVLAARLPESGGDKQEEDKKEIETKKFGEEPGGAAGTQYP